jgi:hypothetical protein
MVGCANSREAGVVERRVGEDRERRLDDRTQQPLVEFIRLDPLREHASGVEMAFGLAVELLGEERRDTRDPGIGRFRHDHVIAAVRLREIRFRVVDDDPAPRVAVGLGDLRHEMARSFDHRRLDLDRVDQAHGRFIEERRRRHAGAESDDRDVARVGVPRERERGREHHRGLVDHDPVAHRARDVR